MEDDFIGGFGGTFFVIFWFFFAPPFAPPWPWGRFYFLGLRTIVQAEMRNLFNKKLRIPAVPCLDV